MAAITQESGAGIPGQRYGSFAGKQASAGGATMHTMKIRHWHRSWVALILAVLKWMF
jgi:hypothetical protein